MKTFLLDGIAHDLKTPLTAIKTCVTTLISFPLQLEDRRAELLSIIDEETGRLQRTITEAIQLARIDSGKIALDRHAFRLRDLAERALPHDDRGRYTISIRDDLAVDADASLLEQAIKQLMANAGKYAPGAAAIEITAEIQDCKLPWLVRSRRRSRSRFPLEPSRRMVRCLSGCWLA